MYDAQRAYTREEEYCRGQRVETNDTSIIYNRISVPGSYCYATDTERYLVENRKNLKK